MPQHPDPEQPAAAATPAAQAAVERIAIHGDLLDLAAAPAWADPGSEAVRWRPDHWLLIEDGRIAGVQAQDPGAEWQRIDHRGRLVLPGFVDAHVHCPQIDMIASYGAELLDWLQTYTFAAELRHADPAHAAAGAERFADALLSHGTTAAVVMPTVHKVSAEALFVAAQRRGMRLVAGKVLMDRNAPEGLTDDVEQAERDCRELIERWHGRDRLAYAVTVRFAPTSSPEQLAMAGALCKEDPTLYAHTHVAENRDEVRWVGELYPEARSYLDVYARAGLLHRRSVLAHGIWLDAEDRAALADAGAVLAHSPSSNLFLGSGLFDWTALAARGAAIAMASDVGAGTSLSMQRTLADAYKVQALRGQRLTAWAALYAATRGAARALALEDEIGSFDAGCAADVCVWDWARGSVAERRDELARSLHERVFAWLVLSDERNLVSARVAGIERYRRGDPP
ncbi:MAG TPA: guanine deaminase [Rubrivivax sp.]|nr:guanine deaminase [Rubrivivax sp.]